MASLEPFSSPLQHSSPAPVPHTARTQGQHPSIAAWLGAHKTLLLCVLSPCSSTAHGSLEFPKGLFWLGAHSTTSDTWLPRPCPIGALRPTHSLSSLPPLAHPALGSQVPPQAYSLPQQI